MPPTGEAEPLYVVATESRNKRKEDFSQSCSGSCMPILKVGVCNSKIKHASLSVQQSNVQLACCTPEEKCFAKSLSRCGNQVAQQKVGGLQPEFSGSCAPTLKVGVCNSKGETRFSRCNNPTCSLLVARLRRTVSQSAITDHLSVVGEMELVVSEQVWCIVLVAHTDMT